MSSANNISYKVKFKVPDEKFRIIKFDRGTFDNVRQISNDTLIFNTAKILKNENKTGLAVLAFDTKLTKDRKLTVYSDVTVNGTTQKTIIDPELFGFVDIGTKIVKLANDTFQLGDSFYHEYVPCIRIKEKEKDLSEDNTKPTKQIEVENCSNHPEKTSLRTIGLPTFIRPLFNPLDLDIPANRTIDSILKLEVMNNTLSDKGNIYFNISSDVVYNAFGSYYKVAAAMTQSEFNLKPLAPATPNLKNSSNAPPPISTNNNTITNATGATNTNSTTTNSLPPSTNQQQQLQKTPLLSLPQHTKSVNSFKANGIIDSLIYTPSGGKWVATGTWSMAVSNGKVKAFDTNMVWRNTTASHTHEFAIFKSTSSTTKNIALKPDNSVSSIRGIMDVGTNGRMIWQKVPTTIDIKIGKTITISLDDKHTDHHFAGQPIHGVLTSLVLCSDKPGANMEVSPTCT
jgi:hypothetical protein